VIASKRSVSSARAVMKPFVGASVVPVRYEEQIVALFARRLDDPTQVHWASGLPGGVFTKGFAPPHG